MIGLKRHTVRLVEYDSRWAALFAAESATLRQVGGELLIDVQHIGSTAVPGLPAKPILDIGAVVRTREDIPMLAERLGSRGYLARGDAGDDGGYLFIKESSPDIRTVHLHVIEIADGQWRDCLAFRDLLRSDEAIRCRYAALKRDLAAKYPCDRKSYTEGKRDFIQQAIRQPMVMQLSHTGIDPAALRRYIDEQIYTLPGIDNHREAFTILLTGSRAIGHHSPQSDVDLDVLCPPAAYAAVHRAALAAGIIESRRGFFCPLVGEDFHRYFGPEMSCPHFSITPLEVVERQFCEYEDVPLWIWTNARVITDPAGQFQRIRDGFTGYPPEVLLRKIKHRWLLADYAGIDIFPLHHGSDDDLLPALLGLTTMVTELLRFFFLVEGKPYPYTERLTRLASTTALGREFLPYLQQVIDLLAGKAEPDWEPWQRLDRAFEMLLCTDQAPEALRLEQACYQAMIAAGVDSAWVAADYDNIDELLWGELGPAP